MATTRQPEALAEPARAGEYFHSKTELYRVEEAGPDMVLLEVCRSGELVEIPRAELGELTRLRRTPPDEPGS